MTHKYFIEPVFWSNPASTSQFLQYFESQYNFTFQYIQSANVCDLLTPFSSLAKGLAVYDDQVDATKYLALTLAGLKNLLPASNALFQIAPCINAYQVITDFTGIFVQNLDAVSWGIQNLLGQCATDSVYSAGQSHDDIYMGSDPAIIIGLDYAVAHKMFIFNLSPANTSFNMNGKTYPGYPEDAQMFDTVMSKYGDLLSVFGWAEPEPMFTTRVSANAGVVLCDAAPDLSFWAKIPAPLPVLPMHSTNVAFDHSKYYFFMQTNEGDTPKVLTARMYGQWDATARGYFPISWGVNPLVGQMFPALLGFYVNTATTNDTWFAGCSGAGYTYPWQMPDLQQYAARVGKLLSVVGPNAVDVWHNVGDYAEHLDNFQTYKNYAGSSVQMFTQEALPGVLGLNAYTSDGTPVYQTSPDLFYPTLNSSSPWTDLKARIEQIVSKNPPPFFVFSYGFLASEFSIFEVASQVQQLFPEFVRIGMQDVVRLARQASLFAVSSEIFDPHTYLVEVVLRNPMEGPGSEAESGRITITKINEYCQLHNSDLVWAYEGIQEGQFVKRQYTFICQQKVTEIATFTDSREMDDKIREAIIF